MNGDTTVQNLKKAIEATNGNPEETVELWVSSPASSSADCDMEVPAPVGNPKAMVNTKQLKDYNIDGNAPIHMTTKWVGVPMKAAADTSDDDSSEDDDDDDAGAVEDDVLKKVKQLTLDEEEEAERCQGNTKEGGQCKITSADIGWNPAAVLEGGYCKMHRSQKEEEGYIGERRRVQEVDQEKEKEGATA